MHKNSNLTMTKEDEMMDALLELIIVAASLARKVNTVNKIKNATKGGTDIDEEKFSVISTFL